MEMKHRIALAVVLSVLIFVGFNYFFPPEADPETDLAGETEGDTEGEPTGEDEGETAGSPADDLDTGADETGGGDIEPGDEGGEPPPQIDPSTIETVQHRLANELLAIDVDNGPGGMIVGVEPLAEQFRDEDSGKGIDFLLLERADGGRTLDLSFVSDETDFAWNRVPAVVENADEDSITLSRRQGAIELIETLTLLDGYEAKYEVTVRNHGPANSQVNHRVQLRTRMGLGEETRYDIHRALCRSSEDLEDFDFDDVEDETEKVKGGLHWWGLDSKYFLQAVVPADVFSGCVVTADETGTGIVNTAIGRQVTLDGQMQKTYVFGIYLGAKVDKMLGAFPESEALSELPESTDLSDAIDWGWFGKLSEFLGGMMLELLRWFYSLTGIWGVAIIMLTVVVKLTLLPLTIKQYKSMRKLKEINPEIQKLREKYGDDKQKMNQEMQALFQREGTNPLSGCVPMVFQFPIWIALYAMLGAVVDLYHESFLWLPDLTQPDPYYILPIGMGALMFVQTRMNPSAGDEQQAKMMQWIMPGVFVVMMLFLPSGLGVYIFANITLSLIQSFIQLRIPSGDSKGGDDGGDAGEGKSGSKSGKKAAAKA